MRERLEAVERRVVLLLWRLLVRRGWAVQLNTKDNCRDIVEVDGTAYDYGWRPIFSVRYGYQPVYRGPGAARWKGVDRG